MGGPLSKSCVAPPFSINFRCQIENQATVSLKVISRVSVLLRVTTVSLIVRIYDLR
jgi:hypothetical protein